jgi:hypothetical protein
VQNRWSSSRVIATLAGLMVLKGVPRNTLRSDNGPEFVGNQFAALISSPPLRHLVHILTVRPRRFGDARAWLQLNYTI